MPGGPKRNITAEPLDFGDLPAAGGARVAAFLERYVITPKGVGARTPFILRPWQREIVDALFDDPRPHTGLVSIPRANGKTTLAAALALYALFADDVDSPSVICVATDERQAGILREIARRMVELSPELEERTHIHTEKLRTPHNDGTLMALPADAEALHGWSPSLLVVDELHVVKEDVWEAATTAAGKHPRGLVLAISTPAASTDSVMWKLVEQARLAPDPAFYFREYTAPPGCEVDDEDAWAEANPALGDFLNQDAMRSLLRTTREATFRRLRLGQWVDDAESWIAHAEWQACAAPRTVEDGARVVLGFDGSVGNDATALVGMTVEDVPHVWVVGLWQRDPSDRNWRVPRDEVDGAIEDAFADYDVIELAADPYAWRVELDAWALKYGEERVLEFPTNVRKRMAPAVARFYSAVTERAITHDADERLGRHVLAAVVRATPQGDTIEKVDRHSARKIDLAVAAVIALERAVWHRENARPRGRALFAG